MEAPVCRLRGEGTSSLLALPTWLHYLWIGSFLCPPVHGLPVVPESSQLFPTEAGWLQPPPNPIYQGGNEV